MSLSQAQQIELYRRMLKIRRFEEAVAEQLKAGLIPGSVHLSIGQEATVAGACMALQEDDLVIGNHRSHGHPIAKGAALPPLMAELMGKASGVCQGKGGSMHLTDRSVGVVGESGIVGAGIPLAAGAGLSAKVRGTEQVALCFFGDGASNEGSFHESLNLAAIWKLPVVFLCENNLYGATSPAREVLSVEDIADRAAGYGIPGEIVDGQDAGAVAEVVARAVARARAGEGPTLVEAKTYRYGEHAEGLIIPVAYRDAEEVEAWKQRDPLSIARQQLLDAAALNEAGIATLEEEVDALVAEAVRFAKASAHPEPKAALEGIYSDPQPKVSDEVSDVSTKDISYFQAIFEAHQEEMLRDENVVLIGEDISLYTKVGMLDSSLAQRVFSTPISENGFTGMGVGAALTGLRPVVDLTIASFVYLAMDQIVNQAAKLHYMTGGQARVPMVLRASMWHDGANAGHHSDRPYPMLMNAPGLKIAVPATPADVKGLLKSAIRDDNPVFIFEDNSLWFQSGPVPEGEHLVPLGVAAVRRAGSDVTVLSIGSTLGDALQAAEELAAEGISVEVIDPRSLVPLDKATILASVAKTGRLVIVDPANRTGSAASEIAAVVVEEGFDSLKKPIRRVTTPDVVIPFSPVLEQPLYPRKADVIAAVKELM